MFGTTVHWDAFMATKWKLLLPKVCIMFVNPHPCMSRIIIALIRISLYSNCGLDRCVYTPLTTGIYPLQYCTYIFIHITTTDQLNVNFLVLARVILHWTYQLSHHMHLRMYADLTASTLTMDWTTHSLESGPDFLTTFSVVNFCISKTLNTPTHTCILKTPKQSCPYWTSLRNTGSRCTEYKMFAV